MATFFEVALMMGKGFWANRDLVENKKVRISKAFVIFIDSILSHYFLFTTTKPSLATYLSYSIMSATFWA
jgi:hypothetical protein